jgi:hypothetical protein
MPPALIPFLPAILGAGASLLGGNKSTQQQTQTTALNPEQMQAWQAALQWANKGQVPGANPLTGQAIQGFQNQAQAGNVGLGALSGNQADYNQLANPYQQNVLDAMQKNFGFQNQNVMNMAADQAQGQNAFGGNRAGIMQGDALSQNMNNQAQQMAGLQLGGYQNTMNQANLLAGYGAQGNNQLGAMGDYLRQIQQQQDPMYHQYDVLHQATGGMQPNVTQSATSVNPWGTQALGGAAMGSGIGKKIQQMQRGANG